ncbi:MAG: patatin-like phospholipase family protein [Pyrinomonadaceae bacterium]|nr:patatin-like phospholipase family protein [Pyrinomonadaceae bacterium]
MGRSGKERVSEQNDEKMAMVLSGGGAYGAYEVGVMKALLGGEMKGAGYHSLEPDVYTGTSVGSFNAAVMVSQPDVTGLRAVERLEEIWLNEVAEGSGSCGNGVYRFRANPLRYLDPDCFANPFQPIADLSGDAAFLARSFFTRGFNFLAARGLVKRALQLVDLSAFISVEPFREMLGRTLRLETVRHSPKELRIVATNWETGEVTIFENHHINEEFGREMIMASAAIPGIFPPVRIGSDLYVDGGTVMNTPLNCAIQAGATTLFVVYLDPDVANIPVQRLTNTIDTMDRVYTIMLATKINEDIDTAAWINEGLTVMERVAAAGSAEDLSAPEVTAFIRVIAQIYERMQAGQLYKKLTIHRFHPHDDLGGPTGMLNFRREAVSRLIDRGFEDAVYHDCYQSHCIFPDSQPPPPKYMGSRWLQTAM